MVVMRRALGVTAAQLRWLVACVVLAAGAPSVALGQTVVQERDLQQREQEKREREMHERYEQQDEPVVSEDATPAPTPEPAAVLFELKKVEVNPSEILSQAEIESVVSEFEGRQVGIADLNEITARLNKLYAEKGFGLTAGAILPKQKIQAGVVRIQLIEGRLAALSFEGNRHTSEWYLRQRVHAPLGELANLDALVPQLLRFNRLHDTGLRVSPKRGTEPGTTDYVIEVHEPRQYWANLTGDNYGPFATGNLRAGANLRIASLLGMRDPLSFGVTTAERATSVYAGYEAPITPYDTRLAVSVDYTNSEFRIAERVIPTGGTVIVNGVPIPQFRREPGFSIDNESLFGNLQLSHPFVVSPRWLLRGFLEAGRRHDNQSVSGMDISGADLTSVYGGISGDWIDNWGSTSFVHRFGHIFRHQLDGANLYKYTGSMMRYQPLRRYIWATVRVQGQLTSSDQLWQSELIAAGGGLSVRGYPEVYRTGHDGYITQVQLNGIWPREIKTGEGDTSQLSGFLFFDHASLFTGSFRRIEGTTVDVDETLGTYLAGAGGGVNMTWNDYVTLQVSVGVPMSERDNISDARVHFAINFTPPVNSWIDG